MMTQELWPGGPQFSDNQEGFRTGTDSLLLADFGKRLYKKGNKRIADLGCGAGLISIILALGDPEITIDGIEVLTGEARMAEENILACGLHSRVRIIEDDLRRHRGSLPAGAYDAVISNPPYYTEGSGKSPSTNEKAVAKSGILCTFDDVCKAAGYLVRFGGPFIFIHKPEMLSMIFHILSDNGFEPKIMRFVHHKLSSPPSLVLMESRRGGKPSLRIEAPLILTNDNGADSDELAAIYSRIPGQFGITLKP